MTGFASKRKMGLSKMSDEVQCSPISDDYGLHRACGWRLKLCWLPKTCFITGQNLWGRLAYHGVRTINGPGEPVYEDYWLEKNEFIIWRLKGN